METTFISSGIKQTQALASQIAKQYFNKYHVLLLSGDLGSGKTTFVQGLANELGIKHKTQSPTFVLERRYTIDNPDYSQFQELAHIDLYRLKPEDLTVRELADNFTNKHCLTIIEWPDKLGKYQPRKYLSINFVHVSEFERKIIVKEVK